jgi:ADP-heptose:LPS heptosyltransferase/GT2 family glycosyltransferase
VKRYELPCGTLYVNEGQVEETFFIQGDPITLKPKQTRFVGGSTRDLVHYLMYPEFWEGRAAMDAAKANKEHIRILIDVSEVDRWGDNLLLTLISKAYRESYEGNITIDVLVNNKCRTIWDHNPDIDNVLLEPGTGYKLTIDLNTFEPKFEGNVRCSDSILRRSGLYTVNKTPVYKVTDEEQKMAVRASQGLRRPIYGIAMNSFAKLKEYRHMKELVELLEERGTVIILDEHLDVEFTYHVSEAAALITACDWVIANDSGLLHLAGALKKKVVGIFGNTDGRRIMEDYEHAVVVQPGTCENKPCWWTAPCAPGATYQEKEAFDIPQCLDFSPQLVLDAMDKYEAENKRILVVMLTFNLLAWTKIAIESIRSKHHIDIFVADNESSDGTQDWLKKRGIEFASRRCGVAAAQNIGFRKFLDGNWDYVLLLNNDVVLHRDTIDSLVRTMEADKGISAATSTEVPNVAPWLIDSAEEGTGMDEVVNIGPGAYSCTLFRRDIVQKVGLFDEHFTPRYIEDNDYTLRLRLAGGKFVKSRESVYYHVLGAVLSTNEEEKRGRDHHWVKNLAYYQEKWGIHPHEPQDMNKLSAECFPGRFRAQLDELLKTKPKVTAVINRLYGGVGDVIFVSVIARELKRLYGERVRVVYHVCAHDSSNNQKEVLKHDPYIDAFDEDGDIRLDLTEVDFRQEWHEIAECGYIMSRRTALHLKIAGLLSKESDLKPLYVVTDEERAWAETVWAPKPGKRVLVCPKGSNTLKRWHGMDELIRRLNGQGYAVIVDDPQYSFRQLCALISKADLVIGPDSGPSNAAGAMDIPVITIFSNRNGKLFEAMFPSMISVTGTCSLGAQPCDYRMPCCGAEGPYRPKENMGEPECLRTLTAEAVEEMVKEILV